MRTYDPRDYGRPSPVFGMSRLQLARWAFEQACARLTAQVNARTIPADVALLKWNALRGAYQKRKQSIELRNWLAARGLDQIVRAA